MKPLKSLSLIANWFLRISVLLFFISKYWGVLKNIDFSGLNLSIVLVCIYCLFGVLLFIGGFQKNATLTVLSGIFIFAISIYYMFVVFNGSILDFGFISFLFPFSIGLYFASNGNN